MTSFPPHFYGYGVQQFAGGPLPVNGNTVQSFNHHSLGPYATQPYASYPRFNEVPRATNQGRRETDSGPFSRFSNVPLENYKGDLYGLCKDQHGCRYLQRKLEERVPENVQMIFAETNMHVVELMTGSSLALSESGTSPFALGLLANSLSRCRSIWKLPVPETSGVL